MSKVIIAHAILPPILIGLMSLLLPPIIWCLEFIWTWMWNDDVIAIGSFERSVAAGSSPAEAFFGGMAFGIIVSGILFISRWLSGHWLHER